MKNFKLMLAATMLAMSVTASAQFANQGGRSNGSSGRQGSVLVKDCDNYNRISLSYAPLNMTHHYGSKSYDSSTLQGFKLGWTGGYSVSQKLPFFIETGLDLSFNTKSINAEDDFGDDYDDYYDDDDIKTRHMTMALTVPVNVTYKLAFKNGFYLSPYFGLHFKVNMLGKTKLNYDGDDDYYYDDDDDDSIDWFSEKDMGKNGTYNRFQMGWRIGSNIGYKNVNLNVGYAADFIPLYKYKKSKIATGGVVVGVGVNF